MDIRDLINRKEALHPDLAQYLSRDGYSLKHPLVFSVPYDQTLNALLNAQYDHKRAAAEQAKDSKDFSHFIFLHERPYRLLAFDECKEMMEPEEYWTLLHSIWIDSENIWQHQSLWVHLLSATIPGSFMTSEEQDQLNRLPDLVTIYRGYEKGRNARGMSYTLNPEKAKWFANRWKNPKYPGVVKERCIKKSRIFAFTNDRNEEEVIVLPKVGKR